MTLIARREAYDRNYEAHIETELNPSHDKPYAPEGSMSRLLSWGERVFQALFCVSADGALKCHRTTPDNRGTPFLFSD
jgi:hypothetical protein